MSEEKAAAAEIEIRTLVERSTLAQARLEAAEQRMAEARAEREKMEETFRTQFKNLANDILGEQSRTFKETNREALDVLLKPFRDNIVEFRERVEKIYSSENEQRGGVAQRARTADGTQSPHHHRNDQPDQRAQGQFQSAGRLGRDDPRNDPRQFESDPGRTLRYAAQYQGRGGKQPAARRGALSARRQADRHRLEGVAHGIRRIRRGRGRATRRQYLASHVASVRQHVVELGRKEYQRLLDSPDFVIMFIPNEPAFLAALQNDSSIWADAYDKKVIISSPTNLFALLKLVDDLWKRNAQNKNTADIVTYGTKLYEQLVAFTASLEGVGQSLDAARDKYNDAYKRLCTGNDNIVRCGERLRKLGIPTKKQQSARTLQAADLPDEE